MPLLVPSCPSIEGLNHIYSNSPSHVHRINSRNRRTNSIRITFAQWPFQEPKLDVHILYKAYIRLNLRFPSIGLDVLGIEEFQPAFGLAWHRVTHDVVGLGWIILNHGFFGRPKKINHNKRANRCWSGQKVLAGYGDGSLPLNTMFRGNERPNLPVLQA